MGLGIFYVDTEESNVERFDIKASKFLLDFLKGKERLKGAKKTTWVKVFAKLRRRVGKARTKQVLKWYVKHHREKFVPLIQSASGFERKFENIEVAMTREEERPTNIESVHVTQKARDVSDRIQIHWPEEHMKAEELAVIQRSLDNYTDYKRRLIGLFTTWYPRAPHGGLPKGMSFNPANWVVPLLGCDGTEILWTHMSAPSFEIAIPKIDPTRLVAVEVFIQWWIEETVEMIVRWGDKWNGKLLSHAFHYRSNRHASHSREIIMESCGACDHWNQFVELLDKESRGGEGRKKQGRKR